MFRRRGVIAAAVALSAWAAPAQAGKLAETCSLTNVRLAGACRGAEVVAAAASAVCRKAGAQTEALCATPLNPPVTRAAVDAYGSSWVHRALASQYDLGSGVEFIDAPWVGTHNSFNSASELPTVSQTDANQQHSLTDQLRMDVRSLELDIHWFPSLWATGSYAPVLCHARGAGELHAGCTTERLFEDGLREVRAWLDANRDQVVLLYLEDHLELPAAFDGAAAALERTLGDRLYRPPGAGCTGLRPLTATRADVLASGAQVIAMSTCAPGSAWGRLVFDDSERASREGGAGAFGSSPDCAANQGRFQRYYEDSTGLSAGLAAVAGEPYSRGLTPEITARMARCGVDLFGFDQLLPGDGRLEALVWSWARDEPNRANGGCTARGSDGRWRATACDASLARACRAGDGTWSVAIACDSGTSFAAPRTGYENELLGAAAAGQPVFVDA